ncbi:MAG TPA: hypothetical protein ENO11_06910 [Desulfobacteraceae bacterium]|nr:hypothetical protein [Desulfobacteraceae bacterium]
MLRSLNLPFIRETMRRFAVETGLLGTGEPRRYLWTDAFAVCNFLELHRLTGEDEYRALTLRLVDQVHQVLGRHRNDDPREGRISGLANAEGSLHPTRGGLRIGKKLPERQPDESFDEQLEWDRDGQYFHYLTKWMHALHRVSAETGTAMYGLWARELAAAAHTGFLHRPPSGGPKRLYWKMSIDLSRPLVPAMGHHDPLDGYLTYLELQAGESGELKHEIDEMEALCRGRDWTTDDPLGIGGLLCDALRVVQIAPAGGKFLGCLFKDLLQSGQKGLEEYTAQAPWNHPAEYRLAFRELGLSIGLQALDRIRSHLREQREFFGETDHLVRSLDNLSRHRDLSRMINDFWLINQNRQTASWTNHKDINAVMLATSLAPDGFFGT